MATTGLRFSLKGCQKIAGGKHRAATGRHQKCDSTPNRCGRNLDHWQRILQQRASPGWAAPVYVLASSRDIHHGEHEVERRPQAA
jgi:hypothetical protein